MTTDSEVTREEIDSVLAALRNENAVIAQGLFHAVPTMRLAADLIDRLSTREGEKAAQAKNPYEAYGATKMTSMLSGARVPVGSQVDTLADRLQKYAFYICEIQTGMADALLGWDLHDAVKAIRLQEKDAG